MRPEPIQWALLICLLVLGALGVVLVLVSAPVWARLVPVWIGTVVLISLTVLWRRGSLRRRGTGG